MVFRKNHIFDHIKSSTDGKRVYGAFGEELTASLNGETRKAKSVTISVPVDTL